MWGSFYNCCYFISADRILGMIIGFTRNAIFVSHPSTNSLQFGFFSLLGPCVFFFLFLTCLSLIISTWVFLYHKILKFTVMSSSFFLIVLLILEFLKKEKGFAEKKENISYDRQFKTLQSLELSNDMLSLFLFLKKSSH